MKSLNKYLSEKLFHQQVDKKLFHQQVDEKLIVNKNLKQAHDVEDIIKKLFDNPEYDDIQYDPSNGRRLVIGDIIDDMIKINFDGYSRREQVEMYNKIVTSFKVLPKDIYASNYKRAIKKSYICTDSKYNSLIETLFKEFAQQETSTSKCCSLGIDNHAMYLMMSEKYMMFVLMNTKASEIYGLFLLEFTV